MITIERVWTPDIELRNALSAADDPSVTQMRMAEYYADCLMHHDKIDWPKLNAAVKRRWPKGLQRVKEKAWKIFNGRLGR